ncbi:hypothetical protein PybrP1_000147 [[Pythium] brassicae (nom. inval.)]|nr:hypothetical protein PybrP1_000147 [[Pythium] brassicae (nom. inval.)]
MLPPKLFTPLTLGGDSAPVQLLHRVVMAPLTRLRSGEAGVPPAFAATYYAQRATAGGLLISEGTCVSPTARGYFGTPGLFRDDQLEAWRAVTAAVHAKGGRIFAQLWHTGRVGHPLNQPNGELPVSASAVPMDSVTSSAVTREGRKAYVTPRALEAHELAGIVEDYRRAAVNAVERAGFDGVELHAANGYLLDQFLCDGVNQRCDAYGGSVENRARLLFETLDAIVDSVAPSKVGIRLSPFATTFGCSDSDPAVTFGHVVHRLGRDYALAYLHLVEPRGRHVASSAVPDGGVTAHFRQHYGGVLLTASGYDRESALQVVADGAADCVAFGRAFLATPDLVARLRLGIAPNEPDPTTFYLGGEHGYTDYPSLPADDVVLLQS